MSQDDIDLLFNTGSTKEEDNDFIASLVATAKSESQSDEIDDTNYISVPAEQMTPAQIQGKLLETTTDALDRSAEAMNAALAEVLSSPADMQTMVGASALIKAHAALIAQLNKVNEVNAKILHNERMTRLKAATQKEISDDQIESKERILMGREAFSDDDDES